MHEFQYNDFGVRLYHTDIHLTRELAVRLLTRLEPFYDRHSRKPDQLTFSATDQKIAALSPGLVTVSDIFDDETSQVVGRVFEILQRIVSTAELPDVIGYDMVVSAVYRPQHRFTAESLLGTYDFIGRHFLRDVDWSPLEAQDRSTGIQWTYSRGEKSYTLRVEPYQGHPDQLFLDMVVQFPDEQVSLLEMRDAVERELDYFSGPVLGFLRSKVKSDG